MRTCLGALALLAVVTPLAAQETLPGTKPLTMKGDLAAQMVAGIDAYLMKALDASVAQRQKAWQPDTSSPEAYRKWLAPKRAKLRKILGMIDQRVPLTDLEYVNTRESEAAWQGHGWYAYTVRWPVLPGVEGDGLLLKPVDPLHGFFQWSAAVVVLPDADQTPEMLAGLAPGLAAEQQVARRLADKGCLVLVPALVDRKDTWSGNPKIGVMTNQPHREFIYRMAFEMGRHIIGYEVQKVLTGVDWLARQTGQPPIGVYGYGEGGLLALYSAALDERIKVAAVSGYFGPRERLWEEPIYRNIWGLLKDFGDKELAMMVLPRTLIVDDVPGPKVEGPPTTGHGRRGGAAPGKLRYTPGAAAAEAKRPMEVARQLHLPEGKGVVLSSPKAKQPPHDDTLGRFHRVLAAKIYPKEENTPPLDRLRAGLDPDKRQHRQFDQLVSYTQQLLPDGEARRREFWARADTSSLDKWKTSTQPYRDYFWEEVIGKLPAPTLPLNVRTRLVYDEPKWKGYEVVLDLYDGVFCYGILLVPKDIKPGERRPVVVCQHGLEGRPTDVCNPRKRTAYYNSFGAQLANRGFIVFAPQNPYIGQDNFRVLQRKANPLGLSIYSFIVRQHERILDWLSTLPFVDPGRIAYYGLSYGGKVAMRIPALLGRYCAVICSGDFNEWIWKNINLVWPGSYMFSGEYEMYEWDLGNTFNYAEMANLIAPRPFMVERGHNDGVGLDEWVAHEYAKVRRQYARLGIPRQTEIEFFSGGHEIHGQGTFAFLRRHLHWPEKADGKTERRRGAENGR
jgi:dienelactone hydrolase